MDAHTNSSQAETLVAERLPATWRDCALGLIAGLAGGLLGKAALGSWTARDVVVAALFGLLFGLFFSKRATTPGAGLIWGLGAAFLVWIAFPAGMRPPVSSFGAAGAMLGDAQQHFPDLVAFIVCLGMPVGITLGIRGALTRKGNQAPFSWGRAIVVGGFAGLLGGMIFGQWMSAGDFFPLLAGLSRNYSHNVMVLVHFCIAMVIGATFGLLFQRDVRGFGSSMGWGLGFGIFAWFFGPMTRLPLIGRTALDWSADQGADLPGERAAGDDHDPLGRTRHQATARLLRSRMKLRAVSTGTAASRQ